MKRYLILTLSIYLFVLFTFGVSVKAETKLDDVYSAYGLKKGDTEIASKIFENPPAIIALKPVNVQWRGIDMPLDKETLIIEKGKSQKFSFDVTSVGLEIKSNITFRYGMNKDSNYLFELDQDTILIQTGGEGYTESSQVRSSAGGFNGHEEGKLYITIALARNDILANLGEVKFEIVGVKLDKGFNVVDITSNASSSTGETSVALPTAIIVGILGIGAAILGGNKNNQDENNKQSRFKMVVYKDFKDKIKYNSKPAFLKARIVEIKDDGTEVNRIDLTRQIEILSNETCLVIGNSIISDDYIIVSVLATSQQDRNKPTKGTVVFRFSGEGGVFQNNIIFNLIDDSYIELDGPNFYVLGYSGKTFYFPYKLINFLDDVKVSVNIFQRDCPIEISLGKDNNKDVIIAIDRTIKDKFNHFYDHYNCEIIAQNDYEYARTVFNIVICYEGILPDFLGNEPKIKGYKDSLGNMEKTLVLIKTGVWNDNLKQLEFTKPSNIEIECEDDNGIFEVIGLDYEIDSDSNCEDASLYIFTADISFPSEQSIKGVLYLSTTVDNKALTSETEIELLPDILEYSKNLEIEYERCKYTINTYLVDTWRTKKLEELELSRSSFGVNDYKIFRKRCWQLAEHFIIEKRESYLNQSYTADEAIAYLEVYVYVGDVAFDIAMMPIGGPIASFLIGQAKISVLELISLRSKNGKIEYSDILKVVFKNIVGNGDAIVEMPKPNERKKLMIWLGCFFVYRFTWHWYFGVDDSNQPIGVSGALENAVKDFTGKAMAGMLGNFVDKLAETSPTVKISKKFYDKEKDAYASKKVTDLGKAGLDKLDKASDKVIDKTIGTEGAKTIKSGIDSIQSTFDDIVKALENTLDNIKTGQW